MRKTLFMDFEDGKILQVVCKIRLLNIVVDDFIRKLSS
jgi:hypothetical protein